MLLDEALLVRAIRGPGFSAGEMLSEPVASRAAGCWPRPIPARFRTGLVSHNDVHPANLTYAIVIEA
jgi:hypothetical protein